MNFKTPLCSHIDRFMVIVSKMTDGKYISLCYKSYIDIINFHEGEEHIFSTKLLFLLFS